MATEIEGLDALMRTKEALPKELVSQRGGPVRTGLRAAGKFFQKAAQAIIDRIVAEPNLDGRNESSGALKKAVIVSRDPKPQRALKGQKGERFVVRLRRSAKAPNGERVNKYGGVLEFGHEKMAAKPWLRPVVPEKAGAAMQEFVKGMRRGIDAAVRKAKRT